MLIIAFLHIGARSRTSLTLSPEYAKPMVRFVLMLSKLPAAGGSTSPSWKRVKMLLLSTLQRKHPRMFLLGLLPIPIP